MRRPKCIYESLSFNMLHLDIKRENFRNLIIKKYVGVSRDGPLKLPTDFYAVWTKRFGILMVTKFPVIFFDFCPGA